MALFFQIGVSGLPEALFYFAIILVFFLFGFKHFKTGAQLLQLFRRILQHRSSFVDEENSPDLPSA